MTLLHGRPSRYGTRIRGAYAPVMTPVVVYRADGTVDVERTAALNAMTREERRAKRAA